MVVIQVLLCKRLFINVNNDLNPPTKHLDAMKTLIAYYSFTHNNEKLAKHIQKKINCDIIKIETVRKRNSLSILFDLMFNRKPAIKTVPYYLNSYDYIIFIAPIWAGKIAKPMKSFIVNEKPNIKQYAFITLCGGNSGQKEKIEKELTSTLDKSPIKVLELWINNLLPAEKKDTIKHTSGFRIDADGFKPFDDLLNNFINEKM